MNDSLGPCPCCKRHVRVTEHRCPFCGKAWLLGAAAAASLLLGAPSPAPAVAHPEIQEPAYGVARPPDKKVEWAWVWDRVSDSWRSQLGLAATSRSWASHKKGTTVTYQVTTQQIVEGENFVLSYQLSEIDADKATIRVAAKGGVNELRGLSLKAAIPDEAKSADQGKETIDVDGRKVECSVKAFEWPGRELRAWTNADGAVVKIVSGEETSRLVRSEEITAAGKKLICAVWETKVGGTTVTEWRSEGVPGLVARWEEVIVNPDKPKAPPLSKRSVLLTAIVEGK